MASSVFPDDQLRGISGSRRSGSTLARELSPMADASLVWDALTAEERAVVREWVDTLGLPCWTACPPLAALLPTLTVHRQAAEYPELSKRKAYEASGLQLGEGDALQPGESAYRNVRRWVGASRGQSVQTSADDAA